MAEHGAKPACLGYRGFPTETCISVNEEICHAIPGTRTLKNGDIVKVDVTTIVNGYYGDTCRTFPVGFVDEKAHNLIAAAKQCMMLGIAAAKPGAYLGDIGIAIRKYTDAFGYSVVFQYCGHGTGLKFHEEPPVHYHTNKKRYGPILVPGIVLTIEPMINCGVPNAIINETDHWTASTADGELSAQFEHTIAITESGNDILTK
jgi:methionyl aminopeptidase